MLYLVMKCNSILQDELIQWNRLTEEMLYLLIVIIGTVSHSTNQSWEVSWLDEPYCSV